jgi:hypothetical protein
MKVWTIPEHVRQKRQEVIENRKKLAEEGPAFIEEMTGLKVRGMSLSGGCFFTVENLGAREVPDFLRVDRKAKANVPGLCLMPKLNTKRGKELARQWNQKFLGYGSLFWEVDLFKIKTCGRLFLHFDTINGVEYIVDYAGYDIEAAGCQPVEI